jgi:porin
MAIFPRAVPPVMALLTGLLLSPARAADGDNVLSQPVGTAGPPSDEIQRPAAASSPYPADSLAPENVFSTASHYLQASNNPIGLEFFVDYFGVFQGNPIGGQSQSFAYSQYLPFGFEWQEPFGWRGGGVRVSAVSCAGSNLSETIGNAFTVSQAWDGNTLFLYQAYLVQKAFDNKLEIGIGRVAAEQFFATLPAFDLLVTGGLNFVPIALDLNSTFTGSASASWFAGARWLPMKETSLTAGVFQARADLGQTGPYHGLDLGLNPNDGAFGVVELGWTPNSEKFAAVQEDRQFTRGRRELDGNGNGLPGVYKLGAYVSNEPENSYPGGWGGSPFGFYMIGQQTLWEQNPGQKQTSQFSVFGGVVWSPPSSVTEMPIDGFAGTVWRGPWSRRPADHLYTSWQIGNFSEPYAQSVGQSSDGAFESVLNAGYIIQITKEFSVQPDIQYIIQPGGFGQANNALVLGLQITIEL